MKMGSQSCKAKCRRNERKSRWCEQMTVGEPRFRDQAAVTATWGLLSAYQQPQCPESWLQHMLGAIDVLRYHWRRQSHHYQVWASACLRGPYPEEVVRSIMSRAIVLILS